nr:unnamed protein product [Callosobruchus chinensis]
MLGYALYPKPRTIIVRSSVCSKRKIFLKIHFPCPLRETSLLSEGPSINYRARNQRVARKEGLCSPTHNSPEAKRWHAHWFCSGDPAKDKKIPAGI